LDSALIRVDTDSTCDIPAFFLEELGISVMLQFVI